VKFLDEVEAINAQVAELRRQKVEAIVVLVHQGGSQTAYAGSAPPIAIGPGGAIAEIVRRLDSAVDVVVSGHAHAFTNAFLHNADGQSILVTQAFSAGTAFADIELTLDRESGDVVERSSAVITTYADAGPGLLPDVETAALVKAAELKVAPLVTRPVGVAARALTRETSRAGESALGNLVADAQRHALKTDFAFMNPGGVRADLPAGPVTWGALFTVQPFGNHLVRLELTGAEIRELLEAQWLNQPLPRIMQISGLGYTWNSEAPVGRRIVEVHTDDGKPLDLARSYSVAVSSFLAEGGDNFGVFTRGRDRSAGPIDLDAFDAYLKAQPQPFNSSIQNRIRVTRWEKPKP
jgi:5'-nucleotidase